MTHRMKKHYNMLNAIHQCTPDERKQLLRVAKPELIHAICDCIVNVVYGKVPISNYNKCQLRKKVTVLKKLSSSKEAAAKKKKLLIQHGGGFLSTILGPVLKTIAGAVLGV